MTVAELTKIISNRVVTRAKEEQDPTEYFCRAIAAIQVLERWAVEGIIPPERIGQELLQWGRRFGLLIQGVEKE